MEKKSFEYQISVRVKFTKEEFDLLWEAFDSCTEMRRYRQKGEFMFGNRNRQEWGDELLFTSRELDKSLKACEISCLNGRRKEFKGLFDKIYIVLEQMSREYKRVVSRTWDREEMTFVIASYMHYMRDRSENNKPITSIDDWIEDNRGMLGLEERSWEKNQNDEKE